MDRIYRELAQIRGYLRELTRKLEKMTVYEYFIDHVKIEKVKGTLQIGSLFEKETEDRKGLHRIHIRKLDIREIEGSGTVGVGVTKKSKSDQKKPEPDAILIKIKNDLKADELPLFFQNMAERPEVLKFFWEHSQNLVNRRSFLSLVSRVSDWVQSEIHQALQSAWQLNQPELHREFQKAYTTELKTWVLVFIWVRHLIPGYLESSLEEDVQTRRSSHVSNPPQPWQADEILKNLKDHYQLTKLPRVFIKLKNHPVFLRTTYKESVQPFVKSDKDEEIMQEVQTKLIGEEPGQTGNAIPTKPTAKLSPQQEAFLISMLVLGVRSSLYRSVLLAIYLELIGIK